MSGPGRNLQIDFFRGLALISIFVDHIPNNPLSHLTIRNLAFSDAAEVFVFLSGFTAAKVFGRSMASNPAFGAAQVLQRCWTLYIAHIFLFVLFIAQVSWTAETFQNPMFAEEMGMANVLQEPHVALLHSLTLQFQPTFLDILPLYIRLLLAFIPIFPLLRGLPIVCIAGSALLWLVVQRTGLSLSAYPDGVWFFNPYAWQFIFVIGMALGWEQPWHRFLWKRWLIALSVLIFVAGIALRIALHIAASRDSVPPGLAAVLWPMTSKTDLGLIRLMNFLALAHVVAVIARRLPQPSSPVLMRVVYCGQHSLYVFCLGIFLSFASHFIFIQYDETLFTIIWVNLVGIGLMVGLAEGMHWFSERKRAGRSMSMRAA